MPRSWSVPRPTRRNAIGMTQFCDSNFVTPRGPPCALTPIFNSPWTKRSHVSVTLLHMYMGVVSGCQDVPEPIWPIAMVLFFLRPTRMSIIPSAMTINSCDPPSADECVMPFMPSIAPPSAGCFSESAEFISCLCGAAGVWLFVSVSAGGIVAGVAGSCL